MNFLLRFILVIFSFVLCWQASKLFYLQNLATVKKQTLTDAAWAWVAPVLPAARPGGRPRTTNLRAIPIFYLLRTGCQWRLLPREFPPFGTVYHYFQAWQNSGVWVHLHRVLYEQARRHAGRAACPSVVIMDGQSVKTTERGGARGFDAHKRVKTEITLAEETLKTLD